MTCPTTICLCVMVLMLGAQESKGCKRVLQNIKLIGHLTHRMVVGGSVVGVNEYQ